MYLNNDKIIDRNVRFSVKSGEQMIARYEIFQSVKFEAYCTSSIKEIQGFSNI